MGRKPLIVGETTKRVVQVLREHMEDQGVSGRELARLADMGATRCRDLLAGERPMLVDELEAMSDALGLVGWMVVREAEQNLHHLRPVAPVSDLSVLRARVESGQVGDVAALDPGYSPEDEQNPDTP